MKYKVVLHESEKGVAISCTSSSGCWSQGENTTEALCSIRDEIENYLLALDNSNFLNMAEQAEFVLRIPGPVVYLYKAGRYYKLGRTKNIRKRHKQIKLQLPFRAIQIHVMYIVRNIAYAAPANPGALWADVSDGLNLKPCQTVTKARR